MTSRSELETIITRAADEKLWHVFSEDPSVIRKLTRLYGEGKAVAQGPGLEWLVPKTKVSFRSLTKTSRTLSPEHILAMQRGKRSQRSKAAADA